MAAALYQKGMGLVKDIQAYSPVQYLEALDAVGKLRSSPEIRNSLMGLPLDIPGEAVSLSTVIEFHFILNGPGLIENWLQAIMDSNESPEERPAKRRNPGHNKARKERKEAREKKLLGIFGDEAIADHCRERYPQISSRNLLGELPFLLGIVGQEVVESGGAGFLQMPTIFNRLMLVEEEISNSFKDLRKLYELGRAWMPKDPGPVLLEAEEKWQEHYSTEVCQRGYLDQQAGIVVPGGSTMGNHGLNGDAKTPAQASGSIISFEGEPKQNMGSFTNWSDGCFSPQFIEFYETEVLPCLGFMEDPTSHTTRFVRCEAPQASQANPWYFQLGSPPKAKLFQACTSSKFGDYVLCMVNYMENIRYAFMLNYLTVLLGKEMAKEFMPPQKLYDMLFVTIGAKSFRFHTDSRLMLTDNNLEGWEERHMRVPTVYFQNTVESLVNLKFRKRLPVGTVLPSTSKGEEFVACLGASGYHEQGYFNQALLQHATEENPSRPKSFRRSVWTARCTGPLQETGLQQLREIQTTVPVYGTKPSDYSVMGGEAFYGKDAREYTERRHDTLDHRSLDTATILPRPKLLPLPYVEEEYTPPVSSGYDSAIVQKDMKTAIRFAESKCASCPQSEWKLIEHPDSIPSMLCTASGLTMLCSRRQHLQILHKEVEVPFGPCPDFGEKSKFARIGARLPVKQVCEHYQLPHTQEYRPSWSSSSTTLNCIHISKRYKSQLESLEQPNSPAKEVETITSGQSNPGARSGFYLYFSGGNSRVLSSTAPTVDKPFLHHDGSSVAFSAPRGMSLTHNPRNMALFEASLQGRVVTVVFSHQNIPQALRKGHDGREMCIHGGMYQVMPMEICPPQQGSDIVASVEATQEEGVKIRGLDRIQIEHLSFLRATHFRCWLKPVETELSSLPSGLDCSGWKTLTIPGNLKTRLCFSVPTSFSAIDLTTDPSTYPTAEELLLGYFQESDGEAHEIPHESIKETEVVVAKTRRRSLSPTDIIGTLARVVVSYCLRVLRVSVDDTGNISYLRDATGAGLPLGSNYRNLLGEGILPLCGNLGENVRVHPYPCPIVSGDAKMIHLQECNRGKHPTYKAARDARHGAQFLRNNQDDVASFFLQCFISETTGNVETNLLWWQAYKERHSLPLDTPPRLPSSQSECVDYLEFIEAAQPSGRMGSFLQGHYVLDKKLSHLCTFGPTLMKVADRAKEFAAHVASQPQARASGSDQSERDAYIEYVADLLSECMGSPPDPFLSSKVLAGMEELISGHPFGSIESVPGGAGSHYGCRIVDWEAMCGAHPHDMTACQHALLNFIKSEVKDNKSNSWYGLLYYDDATDQVYNAINGRELNLCDAEHILCKLYIYYECEPGGGRSMSSSPRPQKRHCFPVKGYTYPDLEAVVTKCVREYMLQHFNLGIHPIPYDGALSSMAQQSVQSIPMAPLHEMKGRRGSRVYVNDQAPDTLPKHIYSSYTFACFDAWRRNLGDVEDIHQSRLQVLEDGNPGLPIGEVHAYSSLDGLPMVEAASKIQRGINSVSPRLVDWCKTFTMHEQDPDTINSLSAYYYHVDKKPFMTGRVLLFPIQGEFFFLIMAPPSSIGMSGDDTLEFLTWRRSLACGKERDKVDRFVKNMQKLGEGKGQTQLFTYRLRPGRPLAVASHMLYHGSIVPSQCVPRKVLLSHELHIVPA